MAFLNFLEHIRARLWFSALLDLVSFLGISVFGSQRHARRYPYMKTSACGGNLGSNVILALIQNTMEESNLFPRRSSFLNCTFSPSTNSDRQPFPTLYCALQCQRARPLCDMFFSHILALSGRIPVMALLPTMQAHRWRTYSLFRRRNPLLYGINYVSGNFLWNFHSSKKLSIEAAHLCDWNSY